MKKKVFQLSIVLIMLLTLPVLPVWAGNYNEIPAAYWGTASYNGNPVNSGTICAYVDQYLCGSISLLNGSFGSAGASEKLVVQSPAEGVSLSGKTVRFLWRNGTSAMWADQTVTFVSGAVGLGDPNDPQPINLTLQTGGTGMSSDASLKALTVSSGELTPAFSPTTFEYTVELPAGTESAPVLTPITNNAMATLEISPAIDITSSIQAERTTILLVRAENGTNTFTYRVVFSVASKPGGACFIATAAYGSYLDPHVWVLRQFRDQVLLQHNWGRAFVGYYYHHSPPAAAFIARHDSLRWLTRCLLTPIIVTVQYPAATLIMFLGGLMFIMHRHKRRSSLTA